MDRRWDRAAWFLISRNVHKSRIEYLSFNHQSSENVFLKVGLFIFVNSSRNKAEILIKSYYDIFETDIYESISFCGLWRFMIFTECHSR